MLGALFLGLAKRRHEITLLAGGAGGHRKILEEYDTYLLDQMIGVVAAATMVAYIIYCASPETHAFFGTEWLVLTTPFPIYGLFRYLYLVHRKDGGGNPSDLLLKDRPLLACVLLWGVTAVTMHDGSVLLFTKVPPDYDVTSREKASSYLREHAGEIVTGILFADESVEDFLDRFDGKSQLRAEALPDTD